MVMVFKKDDVKPGVKTSEFWVTAALMGLTMLVSLGILSPGDADVIKSQAQVIGELIAQLAGPIAVVGYTISRAIVKSRP